jgi:AraC-like DNA-binding protein
MYFDGCDGDFDDALWPVSMTVRIPGRRPLSGSRYSAQLLLPLNGSLCVRPRGGGRWRECAGALVPAGASLDLDGPAGLIFLYLLDPRTNLATFGERDEHLVVLSGAVLERWRRTLGEDAPLGSSSVHRWIRSEFRPAARRMHPRMFRVLHYLRNANLDGRQMSLSRAADIAQLSPSRLMHVFTESVGIPIRPYLLCLRVRRAAAALGSGEKVTQAAYTSGFADAAHLTRTFRSVLGITPGQLVALGLPEPDAHGDLGQMAATAMNTTRNTVGTSGRATRSSPSTAGRHE